MFDHDSPCFSRPHVLTVLAGLALSLMATTSQAQMTLTCEPTSTTLFIAGAGTTLKVKTSPPTEGVMVSAVGHNPGCISVAPGSQSTDSNGEATFTVSCGGVECHSTITFSGTNPWTSCQTSVWCVDPCPDDEDEGLSGEDPPDRPATRNSIQPIESDPLLRFRHARHMTYDYADHKVVRHGTPDKRFVATFCYVNTDTIGLFTSTSVGTEYIDWGILGGTATTQCAGLSDIVSSFNFAYATSSLDTSVAGPGAALTLTFYTSWTGFGADSGNCPVASFAFTGLPGFSGSSTGIGAAYAFTVDLSGGFEFCMPDGRFGYGYRGDGNTGPLLCLTGDGAGGREPATGNSDVFDVWAPDTKGVNVGSFFFGGPPNNFSSWYGQVARADLSGSPASVTIRNDPFGCNPLNSLICCPAPLGGTLSATIFCPPGYLLAFVFAFDTAFAGIKLGGGQVLLCLDLGGSGELLGGPGATPVGGGMFTFTGPVPKNLDLCGFKFSMQAICAFGVTPFALTSACDFCLGG